MENAVEHQAVEHFLEISLKRQPGKQQDRDKWKIRVRFAGSVGNSQNLDVHRIVIRPCIILIMLLQYNKFVSKIVFFSWK